MYCNWGVDHPRNDCVQLHTFCVVILGWLVDKEDVESAMQGTLIDEDKIECIYQERFRMLS